MSMSTTEEQVSVILEPEGLYEDTTIETSILASSLSKRAFEVHQYRLGEEKPYTDIPETLRSRVHGLFVFRHWVTEEDLLLFPNLRSATVQVCISEDQHSSTDGMDSRRIDYGTTEVADHAITLSLALRRGVLLHHDLQRNFISKKHADWTHYPTPLLQRPSAQRTFGVLGLGRIGTAVALRAKALGWSTVLFFDPYTANGMERALGLQRARTIEELFERSDTLSLHVPLTKETRGIVGSVLVGRMKEGS
ncbi:9910_t:CDS:2, partial [Acaulospora colombiana]